MKFGKTWRERIEGLPAQLRGATLDYKKWKRLAVARRVSSVELKRLLVAECTGVEQALKTYAPVTDGSSGVVKALIARTCSFLWGVVMNTCGGRLNDETDRRIVSSAQLLDFVALNRDTLRKICKRVDKRRKGTTALVCDVYGAMRFSFLHGSLVSRLELELGMRSAECPVCLWCEALDEDMHLQLVILDCGHTVCTECFDNMFGRKYRKGLECPVCRCVLPQKPLMHWPDFGV
jgi:hypothetical protein